MADQDKVPPDIGGRSISYADRAKMNIRYDQKLQRNVLEIEVEKDNLEDEIILSEETVAKLLNKIKLNINAHVEGYQISFGRKKSKIEVLCKQGLNLEQFCVQESLEVEKGVKTNFIRPAGRKDVEVTVTGLGFNTPDSLIQEYITKFGGKMVTKDVIYGKYGAGLFQGKLNGVRKYRVDFTEAKLQMGTFHILDGQKVKVFYRGNRSTCGWCQADVTKCPGGAKAKSCKEAGTKQVHLSEHMKEVWSSIEFNPQNFEISEVEYDDTENADNIGGDRKVLQTFHFPRKVDSNKMSPSESAKYNVVRINNFPREITNEDVVKFITNETKEVIDVAEVKSEKTTYSTNIYLGPGPSQEVIAKVTELLDFKTTNKTFFGGRKLHVQLHRPLTPKKKEINDSEESSETDKEKGVMESVIEEDATNKIKAVVSNFNKILETPKQPLPGKKSTQQSYASARKPSLDRHKSLFK